MRDRDGQRQAEPGAQAVAHGHRARHQIADVVRAVTAAVSEEHPVGDPGLAAVRRPSARAQTGRASAAAAAAMIRPVTPIGRARWCGGSAGCGPAPRRRRRRARPGCRRCRRGSVPTATDRFDCHGQVEVGARGGPVARHARYPGSRAQLRRTATAGSGHRAQCATRFGGDPIAEPFAGRRPPGPVPGSRGQGHRPEVGAQEVGPQRVHRTRVTCAAEAVPSIRSASARADLRGVAAQLVVVARRQHEQRGRHTDQPARSASPASRSPMRSRRRARRQHESQQGGALPGGDGLAEHSGEAHAHTDDEHHRHRQPRNRARPEFRR